MSSPGAAKLRRCGGQIAKQIEQIAREPGFAVHGCALPISISAHADSSTFDRVGRMLIPE
jgi:uncharacterized protein (UPF0276 family)